MRITSSLTARAANANGQYLVGTGSPNVHDSLAGNCELVLQEQSMEHECEGAKPRRATDHGLQLCGQYYEGFVDDYEAVYTRHRIETVTSYGVRRSRQNTSGESNCHPDDKENLEAQDNNSQKDQV